MIERMRLLTPRFYRAPYSLVVAAGLGLLLGVASQQLSLTAVLVMLGLLYFGFATLKRPELAVLSMLAVTSTIIDPKQPPPLPIGIGSAQPTDLILFALLGIAIARTLVEPDFRMVRTPLDLPILLFWGVMVLSTFMALLQAQVDRTLALRELRTGTYWLLFFAITGLVRSRNQFRLLIEGFLLLATGVAGAMVLQFLAGPAVRLLPGRVESVWTQGQGAFGDVTRILPPGQSLVLVGFVLIAILMVIDRTQARSWLRLGQAALVGSALVLTFNRNFWVAVLIAVLLAALLLTGRERRSLVTGALMMAVVGAIAAAIVAAGPPSRTKDLVLATTGRMATLVTSDTLEERSLRFRYVEYDYAIPQVLAHPILGMGLGTNYRPFDSRLDGRGFDGRDYVHNGHLWLMLKVGLLGYAVFLFLSTLYLTRALRGWRNINDPYLRATALAFALAYAGTFASAVVNPIYREGYWVPVLALMLGATEVALRIGQGDTARQTNASADPVG